MLSFDDKAGHLESVVCIRSVFSVIVLHLFAGSVSCLGSIFMSPYSNILVFFFVSIFSIISCKSAIYWCFGFVCFS